MDDPVAFASLSRRPAGGAGVPVHRLAPAALDLRCHADGRLDLTQAGSQGSRGEAERRTGRSRSSVAWDKTAAARPVLGRFRQQAEFIVWGSKGPMSTDRRCNIESNVLPGVLCHRVNARDKHHVTGKPTALMRDVVRICEPGGTILDPFAGSGTTGVAALELGYRFLGCEMSAEYAGIAKRRLRVTP